MPIVRSSIATAVYLGIMGKTKDKQHVADRHILTDLVEEADDVLEVERRMQDADFLSLEEVKTSLGLNDPD